jgi:diguanylate cyclase (GGDEF)-like protein
MQFFVILALAIALFAVLFAIQNTDIVTINLFTLTLQERLALVLLLTLAAGVLIGLLVSIPALVRRSMRISSVRRELEEMGWRFQEKDKEIASYQQASDQVRQQNTELMGALGNIEPKTGLLRSELVAPSVSYLLQRMANNVHDPRYNSVSVYEIDPYSETEEAFNNPAVQSQWLRAVSRRLQQTVSSDSWLYHDGRGRFVCVTHGLTTKTASDYGETLRAALAEESLHLDDGSVLPIAVSIGGAITHFMDQVDSHFLIRQADEALDHAKRRGRNRFRLVEAKGGTS